MADATTPVPTDTPTPADEPRPDQEVSAGEEWRAEIGDLVEQPFDRACRFVDDTYCDDVNANGWPDAVEVTAGWDPSVDECLVSDCPGATIDELLLSLQDNTLFILDSSGSMAGDAGGGQTKMAAAKEALVAYAQGSPDFADLGLMVYGHRGDNSDAGRPESCQGIEVLAEVGEFGPESAAAVVGGFEATGWTPIGAALQAAGPVLQRAAEADAAEGVEGATNRIILISDGIETCDGDPVGQAQALVDPGIEVVVDVVGFDIGEADRAALEQVAGVTGGRYIAAGDGQALRDVLAAYQQQIFDAIEPIRCQREAIARYRTCRNELSADMRAEFSDLSQEALQSGDREAATFWSEWYRPLFERHDASTEERHRELQETSQRFLDEVEAARQRRSELLSGGAGDEISSVSGRFTCPFDEVGGVV